METQETTQNADPQELARFSALAHRWWDPESEFKPLHQINPLRLDWIDRIAQLSGKSVLDVGCGGGILAEAMVQRGAKVKGIDLSDKGLKVARFHLLESGLSVDYEAVSAEDLAAREPGRYDVVTCMELLEHVPNPESTVAACAALAKPGAQLFFSTINRNPKSYLFAVIGAEYVLKLLPRGTHDYAKFIKPSELARYCRGAGLDVSEIIGMTYNPFTKVYALGRDTDVNYLVHAQRPSGGKG
ncbi:MAG: bifunctional 2-polyprenyl-6-hydroxyphenol methylase/3-demethylubiquinol 3-O-methyltransferase UbiG [Betaproteobacteria bacterium]|nr:bifunctional 2-polyprenyl-6-hydroxyphenol methylase/3-demethylubiquinol 3-O-methyltransferase UbiG [Betaproteobacteria bacterium]